MISNIVCFTLSSKKHWEPSIDYDEEEVPPEEHEPLIHSDTKPHRHQGNNKHNTSKKHNPQTKQYDKHGVDRAKLKNIDAGCDTQVLGSDCVKEDDICSSATFDPLRLRYWLEIVIAVSHVILIFLGIKVLNVIMHFYIMYKQLFTHIDLVSVQ